MSFLSNSPILNIFRSGGNFRLIAHHISTIYYCVRENPAFSKLNNMQRLLASAIIDCYPYLTNGSISLQELEAAVIKGYVSRVSLCFHEVYHRYISPAPNDLSELVGLIMQCEALIFFSDESIHLSPEDIVQSIVSHKSEIVKSVSTVMSKGRSFYLYQEEFARVSQWASIPDFADDMLNYFLD